MAKAPAPLLALKAVRLMDGATPLFDGVDIALEPRMRACLVGRNGAGKSTLMRMLSGLIEPDSGERYVQQGLRFAFVLQEPEPTGATVRDWVCSGGVEPYAADAELAAFGIDPDTSCASMSGGEKRRAALAKAFAEAPDLLFLKVPEGKQVKNRLHLDLRPEDQAAEVARAEALGATRTSVGQGDDVTWVVLADPEGNEFCILRALTPEELADT